MVKKNKSKVIWFVVSIAIFLSVAYFLFTSKSVGVLVSCNEHKILEIRNVPPPLMQVVQTEICKVNITSKDLNGNIICNASGRVFETEKGVIECNNLRNYKGKSVRVEAIFIGLNNTLLGTDVKQLEVNP